jgi:hypothetical protein
MEEAQTPTSSDQPENTEVVLRSRAGYLGALQPVVARQELHWCSRWLRHDAFVFEVDCFSSIIGWEPTEIGGSNKHKPQRFMGVR